MAPRLAESIEALLEKEAIYPTGSDKPLPEWSHPALAPLPWQEEGRWDGRLADNEEVAGQ